MALRFMQIFIPDSEPAIPDDLLEGREVLGRWRDSETNHTVLHLLIPAEETEPVMDAFEKQYADTAGFHVVLFPVEATLPRPPADPKKEEQPTEQQERQTKNGNVRISREELYSEVSDTLGVTRIFIILTILSTIVAAVGLMRNDVAVIIGAMVIAPLLGPNVAMSLATTLGDTDLLRRALKTNLVGVASALAFAVLVGFLFHVNPETPAIASRTGLKVGDILLALAAGAAGTLAFTHGIVGAVIGVMVAVALVPPLVVCGLLFGGGYPSLAGGALLLTAANVICINLAGVVTFFLQGVRPRNWWEAEHAKSRTFKAMLLWTVLLAVLLAILWFTQVGGAS